MRTGITIFAVAAFILAAAAGGVAWIASLDAKPAARPAALNRPDDPQVPIVAEAAPKAEPKKPIGVFIDQTPLEEGGIAFALQYTGPIRDPRSLTVLRDAIRARGKLGLAVMGAELDQLFIGSQSPRDQIAYASKLHRTIGLLDMYEGEFDAASASFDKAMTSAESANLGWKERTELRALLGVVALRRGEISNCIACVGPSSCIFPIAPEAMHKQQAGSREAIEHFTKYLDELPGDLRIRWLLNLAYMTLGEYPEKVPPKYLIPTDVFRSKLDVGKFKNVATAAKITTRGPNMAGGSIFDDFNGDGRPDLFVTSLDATRGASMLINRGDGTFEDRSTQAGLDDQIYVLNVTRGDFDNDGDLDVFLLRGAWDVPMRPSLLKNKGDGTFEDVTFAAGVGEPISSESATWGDFDNDGFIDLFVCGESYPPEGDLTNFKPDPRNKCRLYRNNGDGTFKDVAAAAGVQNLACAKGSAWGDYDGDGKLDLFVSNMDGPCRLYHNEGDGTFKDMALLLGIRAERGFACWFWDYDNDGKLDIYVNGKGVSLAEEVALALGMPAERPIRASLYKNLGSEGFRNVTQEVGLDRPTTPMGCNITDIDNDGYLDVYLGTGAMSYAHLVPNLMYKNVDGKRFEDVTMSSGTGHLQKGHGISFADYDDDGDLDMFVEAGGAVPGDNAYNLLFQNPGHGRHWLKMKLIGTKTNRSALGAKIRAVVKGEDGKPREIHRTVGNNSSFGGNSLVELLGLGDAKSVSELEITWPTSGTTQTFRDLPADRTVAITEGADAPVTVTPKAR